MNGFDSLRRHTLPEKSTRTWRDYVAYPFLLTTAYFHRIFQICAWHFVIYLVVSQMLVKGVFYIFMTSAMLPIFQDLNVDIIELQILVTIVSSPWSLKPVIGALSDLLTIRGYHKRYWLIQSVLMGIVAASLTFATRSVPAMLALSFVGINHEMAIVDLLTESKYAEKMQEFPESGTDLVTFVSGLQMAGGTIAMIFTGYVSDVKAFWIFFMLAIILAATPLIPSVLGWLPEIHEPHNSCIEMDWSLFSQNKSIFIVVFFTGLAGPVVAFFSTYANKWAGLILGTLLLMGLIIGTYSAFPRLIAHVALYQVLVRLSKPSMRTALDYFFTATPQCLSDGPHFTFTYFITYTGLISQVVGFFGAWLYQSTLSKFRYRPVLIFTTALVGLGGLSDLIIVLRWNRRLGISDRAFYIIGEAVFESIVAMLYWIPSSVIISKVCPQGMESATYAFLAGISNFGLILAKLSGAAIYKTAGVSKCSFGNLWLLVLVFHILLPIIGGVPATFLIPNLYQNVDIVARERMLIRETDAIEFEQYTSGDSELDFQEPFPRN